MDWWKAKQQKIAIPEGTNVAQLIVMLLQLPLDYPVRNADGGSLCEINVATDGIDKEVAIY